MEYGKSLPLPLPLLVLNCPSSCILVTVLPILLCLSAPKSLVCDAYRYSPGCQVKPRWMKWDSRNTAIVASWSQMTKLETHQSQRNALVIIRHHVGTLQLQRLFCSQSIYNVGQLHDTLKNNVSHTLLQTLVASRFLICTFWLAVGCWSVFFAAAKYPLAKVVGCWCLWYLIELILAGRAHNLSIVHSPDGNNLHR